MSDPPPKIEKSKDGATSTPPKVDPPRDIKGKFVPKPSIPKPPETPPEPDKPKIAPPKDQLLDEIEAELTIALKDNIDLKSLESLDQRLRIQMMRIMSKAVNTKKSKDAIDPTNPPPPVAEPITTLLDINRADKFRADIRKKNSYLDIAHKIRGKK